MSSPELLDVSSPGPTEAELYAAVDIARRQQRIDDEREAVTTTQNMSTPNERLDAAPTVKPTVLYSMDRTALEGLYECLAQNRVDWSPPRSGRGRGQQ